MENIFPLCHLSLKKLFVSLGCIWSLLLPGLFSSCWERRCCLVGVCRLLTAVASLVAENRLEGGWLQQLQLLDSRAQAPYLWRTGFGAPWYVGSSQSGDQTHVSCIDRRILYHWASREARCRLSFNIPFCLLCRFFFIFFFSSLNSILFLWLIDFWIITRKVFQLGD